VIEHELVRELAEKSASKIVLVVADGLGGLPLDPGGRTELETANTPHLDALVRRGTSGSSIPVLPGITPGSGPGHLGLFGYDPLEFRIGRGALEATGIGFELGPDDVAARGNFCTLDSAGLISDRRAGRIPSEESFKVVERLQGVKIAGVETFVKPVKEHRFVVVFRGHGLDGAVADTDPQATGVAPLDPQPHAPAAARTAEVAKEFVAQARRILADEPKANGLVLRGFAAKPRLPSYEELYRLRAAAIAVYPMYKGLARLVGMTLVGNPHTLEEQIDTLAASWQDYDFFFLHFKYTDSTGEDGAFEQKVKRIEELDRLIPRIEALGPDVLIVTGDHSTPSVLKSHSWHPVPTVLAAATCRPDGLEKFSERDAWPLDPSRDTEPKMLDALRYMSAKEAPPVVIANHPSRSATEVGGYGQYDPAEFRDWSDTAPNVAIGMEGAPGHQAGALEPDGSRDPAGSRGGYRRAPPRGVFDGPTRRNLRRRPASCRRHRHGRTRAIPDSGRIARGFLDPVVVALPGKRCIFGDFSHSFTGNWLAFLDHCGSR
jgi:2,3-bisphosphoglycerate-independent phosphoglycerate mutase